MDKSQPQFYTAKEINEIRASCQHYKLDAPIEFWTMVADKLKYVCNGAGPDRWSEVKRRALTSALKLYEPAFAIHDVEYEYQIGTQRKSDKRLKRNMLKIWRKNFGFWRWFSRAGRIERLVVIPTVYAAVAIGGGQAWKEVSK